MNRDDEIQRLIKYAQALGVPVRFKPYVPRSNDGGGWSVDGSEIVVYTSNGDTKIGKILILIHEIAHHKGWIENGRKTDPKVTEALLDEEEKKKSRKRIYLGELKDTRYWEQIYKDANCAFDIGKLYAAKEYDIWQYEVFYETGKFPTTKEKAKKTKELSAKYKRKKNS